MAKIHEIDLNTMVPSSVRSDRPIKEENKKQKIFFKDGELNITAPGDVECMQTVESYSFPLRIDVIVKTNDSNIRLYYKEGRVILNWERNKDELRVHDMMTGKSFGYFDTGRVPENEYVEVSWIIDKKETLVLVNEELRCLEENYPYMTSRAVTQNIEIREPVKISAAWKSTITVKSMKIIELDKE